MQSIIHPKCPYCHKEFRTKSILDNPLRSLYGDYCSDTVSITCPFCGQQYFVSKQVRFLARKNR